MKNKDLTVNSKCSPVSRTSPFPKNVLLLGFGFKLYRNSGDKNFWLGLSKELSAELDKLVIVSVNSSLVKFEKEKNIYLYNAQLPFHRKKDGENILRSQHQKHPLAWEILERSATLLKLIPFLKKLVKLHNIQIIHLMDNFGVLTGLIKVVFPKLQVYVTAFTYNTHGLPSKPHSIYRKVIFGNFDKVVVASEGYREKLLEHNFSKEKVIVIRWGVPVENGNGRLIEKEKAKRTDKTILWTGFTQQIKEKSFHLSLSLAHRIIQRNPFVNFIFAFKPECFDKEYRRFQAEHLKVMPTNPEEFFRLLKGVDLLLAPVENDRSTVAPPLTWIECMLLGIPVISTQAPGVDEILIHNQTGFVAKSNEELESLIEKVLEDKNLMSEVSINAKELVKEKYNLKDIAQDYLRLWRENVGTTLSS